MELIRNYLKADELSLVVAEMEAKGTDSVSREIVKVGIVAQLLVKDLGKFETCDDIYNYIMESNFNFDTKVFNYYMIDILYKENNSIEKILKDFFDSVNSKLDEGIKSLPKLENIEEIVNKLKELNSNG